MWRIADRGDNVPEKHFAQSLSFNISEICLSCIKVPQSSGFRQKIAIFFLPHYQAAANIRPRCQAQQCVHSSVG